MLIKKVYGGFRGKKQRLLTDFFTYYPMGGALYDKNGALIDINKSLNEKFPFTNEADFLLNNLFSYRFVDRSSKNNICVGEAWFPVLCLYRILSSPQ